MWPFTQREEYKLEVSGNKMARNIFWQCRNEVDKKFRVASHNEQVT
jgi:hypothetical protein